MINFKKIGRILLAAVVFSALNAWPVWAEQYSNPALGRLVGSATSTIEYSNGKYYIMGGNGKLPVYSQSQVNQLSAQERELGNFEVISDSVYAQANSVRDNLDKKAAEAKAKKEAEEAAKKAAEEKALQESRARQEASQNTPLYQVYDPTPKTESGTSYEDCQKTCTQEHHKCVLEPGMKTYACVDYTPKTFGTNTQKNIGEITGCTNNKGLFAGLINTGREIFEGLRDLIYVVAGFGIIGVAVGGFFGNLNWKWLGAIVIGLVVIASTGELITAITGCEEFTQGLITDTLK